MKNFVYKMACSITFAILLGYVPAGAHDEIKPLAAICAVDPNFKTVRSGPFSYDDSAGGFPSDRMREFCVGRGASSYLNTKVNERFISGRRNFTFYCLKRVALKIKACEVIQQCRIINTNSENISSLEYWHKAYKCK